MNSENDSYIVNKSSYLPEEKREGTNVSPGCVKVFDLIAEDINDLTAAEIQRTLGVGFTVSKKSETIIIRESENVIISENGHETDEPIRPLCDYSELIDFYMIYFGIKDENGEETGQYEFDLQIFVDVITSTVPNDGTCYCIKPCEVSSGLEAAPGIGPYSMNSINQHLISNTYDLPDDFPIDEISADILDGVSGSLCGEPSSDPADWPLTIEMFEEDDGPKPLNNGIEICNARGEVEPCSGIFVGESLSRNSEGDLCHGLNDISAINGIRVDFFSDNIPSPEELCEDIEALFNNTTMESFMFNIPSELRPVALDFLDVLKNNRDDNFVHSDIRLSEAVANDINMQNYMKVFGAEMNNFLNLSCGDITGLNVTFPIMEGEDPEQIRPFLGTGNKATGLKILVNDTEATQVSLIPGSYSFDSNTNEWEATLCFTVCDHYGLDRKDVMDWQFSLVPTVGSGFAAWWYMQKIYEATPFETKMYMSATLKGKLSC